MRQQQNPSTRGGSGNSIRLLRDEIYVCYTYPSCVTWRLCLVGRDVKRCSQRQTYPPDLRHRPNGSEFLITVGILSLMCHLGGMQDIISRTRNLYTALFLRAALVVRLVSVIIEMWSQESSSREHESHSGPTPWCPGATVACPVHLRLRQHLLNSTLSPSPSFPSNSTTAFACAGPTMDKI